ncbi:MAG: class I SAM-dependent methyltransferase [Candidatus Omnitrophica bacterium]|nr:class I SAM-dependent methyltransferase [Candidatus Omnitrophota bacterium]
MKQRIKKVGKWVLSRTLNKVNYDILPLKYRTKYPPGHFASPIPSKEEILKNADKIFSIIDKKIAGIDLNEEGQLALLGEIKKYYDERPFADEKKEGLRYHFKNEFYPYSDAIFLYGVMKHFKPGRIVEVGSGYSSAAILDTNEYFFKNKIKCCFIDPEPDRLFSLFKKGDKENHKIVTDLLQDADIGLFEQLEANDILFIDSSHVLKIGSDLSRIFFEIMPMLKTGVLIHFHDIFYPFEYPKDWVFKGVAWNENYILRAFLQYNPEFKITLFNSFLEHYHAKWFSENMPLCLEGKGASIWLRKL